MEQKILNSKLQEKLNSIKNDKKLDNNLNPSDTLNISADELKTIATQISKKEEDVFESEIVAKNDISIKISEESNEQSNSSQAPVPGDDLFDSAEILSKESEEMSKILKAKQEAILYQEETGDVQNSEIKTNEEEVSDIIEKISASKGQMDEEPETDDIEEILDRIDRSKVYSTAIGNNADTGPADYIIEEDKTYTDTVKNVLDQNNIRFIKTTNTERNALLERYTNVGTKISLTLPNSGIYIQFSGAGVDELIAMNQIDSNNPMNDEINKLSYINNHIVNSSIGPMKLQQLIKVISFYDLNTLYYGLFAATHPDEIELSRTCGNCGETYFLKARTRDLLINSTDFKKSDEDIRNNVTTYKRLLEQSQLCKIRKKVHSNGMIIYYKHPSIESYLTTYYHLNKDIVRRYDSIINFAFCIDKIALKDTSGKNNGGYIEYTDPNDIVIIISRLKNVDDKYEIVDMIDDIRPSYIPNYGYHKSPCPHCGALNEEESLSIVDLLFTLARDEDWLAMMKRASKVQKKKLETLTKE